MSKIRISLKQFTIQHEKDLFTELENIEQRLEEYEEFQKKDGGYSTLIKIQKREKELKKQEWHAVYSLLNQFYGYDKW